MAADSTAAGFLTPVSFGALEDADLDDLFRPTIAALCGLDPIDVWPKWQDNLPTQPNRGPTWCAFGVMTVEADLNPSVVHDGQADGGRGLTTEYRTEKLDLLCSFYGPSCRSAASLLRDAIHVGQNRAALRALGLAWNGSDPIRSVPDLQKQGYVRRADLTMRFSRFVTRTYAIRNVAGLTGAIDIDGQSVSGPATLADPL